MEHPNHELRNSELDTLFAEYKSAVPDRDASPNFMPQLWRKIEARQNMLFRMKRLTQFFVAAAAAICILLATIVTVPNSSDLSDSYVDVLAKAYPTENLRSHGIHEADTK